jgi:thiamine-monophosphate kinase
MRGVGALAQAFETQVIGGDMTSGPAWSIAVTVLGRAIAPLSRVGAKAGDNIWVTGTLGAARAAFTAWLAGDTPPPAARAAFVRPQPRIAAGRWLAEHGATALMDISDGLGGDAPHLAAASNVALRVDVGAVPIHPVVHAAVRKTGGSAAVFATTGGEDYELLVTMPAAFADAAGCEAATGVPLTRIGTVTAGDGAHFTLSGAPITVEGFRHAL